MISKSLVAAGAACLLASAWTAAAAPLHCNSKASSAQTSTLSAARRTCPHAQGAVAQTASAPVQAAETDRGALTPLAASQDRHEKSASRELTLPKVSLLTLSFGPAPRVTSRTGPLPLDHGPVAANLAQTSSSLAAVLPGGMVAKPVLSAPAAWSLLLLGLIGLCVMMPRPDAERVRTWAMTVSSRAAARAGLARLEPIEPDRYARSPRRSHQGHFVRQPRRAAFGPRP